MSGEGRCDTLTVPEAARRLGLSRNAAYDAAARGELPGAFRVGRRVLVSRPALEAFLASPPQPVRALEVLPLQPAHRSVA